MSEFHNIHVEIEMAPATPKRSRGIRIVRGIGWTFLWVGLFLLGFVAHQLFFTTWLAQQNNEQLTEEATAYFGEAEISKVPYVEPTTTEATETENTTTTTEAPVLLVEQTPPDHQAFAIIRIPTLERLADGWTVVQGVTRSDLRNGAGHMTSTPLPGQPGNAVISGHRTTYGAPFNNLDELESGDLIEVETAIGVHTYAVRETIIVKPTELWVVGNRPGAWLTLTTCNPKLSSRQRLVVFAEMVDGPNARAILG